MNYVLALLGFALFIVLGMIKTKQKHSGKEFSALVYLKDEIFTIIASAISAVSFILMIPDVGHIITPEYAEYTRVLAFAGGFMNYTLIDRVMNIFLPKKFKENKK